jgi:hypothetical protein
MNKIVVGGDGIESVGNLELNQSRTHKHFWLVDKRESLVNRISRTTNDEVKIVLELLRDLYTYLIKADDKFSDNLKFQFEQVEDKLALYPTAEDMKRLHAQISDIISQIQNEVGDELKSDLAVIEKRLSDLESPHRLIISGQNEIIKTREFLCINSKLDAISLFVQQNVIDLKNQLTQIKQSEDKADQTALMMVRVQENLRSIERMIANPLLNQFIVGIGVICLVFIVTK